MSSGDVSGAIVDLEIYNTKGERVNQKIIESQQLKANVPKSYQLSWTLTATGNYVLKVGLFTSGWSKLLTRHNNAVSFSVQTPIVAPTTSSTSSPITIWWITSGAVISGDQPLKALIQNRSIDSYNMYWQVDGGQLNWMSNNNNPIPHKEVQINVNGWWWRGANGSGPYTINFVAKELTGNVISQQQTTFTVQH